MVFIPVSESQEKPSFPGNLKAPVHNSQHAAGAVSKRRSMDSEQEGYTLKLSRFNPHFAMISGEILGKWFCFFVL